MDEAEEDLHNIVNEGILRGISVAFNNGCFGSAVVLIYAGIDAMAYLSMPEGNNDVTREDFVQWVNTYLEFQSVNRVSGLELYGARCGMVHKYGVFSRLSRRGQVRVIGYVDEAQEDVMIDETGESSLVLISIRGFAFAFRNAIQRFIDEGSKDDEKRSLIRRRIRDLAQCRDVPEHLRST